MGDYIKRTLALDVINHANDCDCFKNYDGYSMAFDMIDEMPRADVQKVKHGKWETSTERIATFGFIKSKCSVCGAVFRDDRKGCEYCSNCGARMDLKE